MGFGLVQRPLLPLLLLPILLTLRAPRTLLPATAPAQALAMAVPVRVSASGSVHVRRFGPPPVADADAQIVNPGTASPHLTGSANASDAEAEADAQSGYPTANDEHMQPPDDEFIDDPATTGKRLHTIRSYTNLLVITVVIITTISTWIF